MFRGASSGRLMGFGAQVLTSTDGPCRQMPHIFVSRHERHDEPGPIDIFHTVCAHPMTRSADPIPVTPDGRYLVVRGRLWRRSNPALAEDERRRLVTELMTARRTVALAKRAADPAAEAVAHAAVDRAKQALGERGPVWWDDGAPDFNRHMARTTPYADWHAALQSKLEG